MGLEANKSFFLVLKICMLLIDKIIYKLFLMRKKLTI